MRFVVYEKRDHSIATTILGPATVLLIGALGMALVSAMGSIF